MCGLLDSASMNKCYNQVLSTIRRSLDSDQLHQPQFTASCICPKRRLPLFAYALYPGVKREPPFDWAVLFWVLKHPRVFDGRVVVVTNIKQDFSPSLITKSQTLTITNSHQQKRGRLHGFSIPGSRRLSSEKQHFKYSMMQGWPSRKQFQGSSRSFTITKFTGAENKK